jgi:hypothetical protein
MRHTLTTIVLAGALAASTAAFAQSSTSSSKPPTKPAAAAKPATASTHSVQGVVTSVDASSLVITPAGKKGGEMKFAMDASTQREGTLATGTTVSVRYHTDGSTNMATAVHAQPSKSAKKK